MFVTVDYYKNTYKGYVGNNTDDDIEKNLNAATDVVNVLTLMKLVNGQIDFDKLPPYTQNLVQRSTCIIAENYLINGGYEVVQSAQNSGLNSATVGKFSYTESDRSSKATFIDSTPPMAIELLLLSGLMHSGVCVRC